MLLANDVRKRAPREIVRPNAEWNLADEQTASKELLKCAVSFEYFVETFCYIRDKVTKKWVRFELWDEQKRAANYFATHKRVVTLKPRQMGISWLAQAYAVWHMIFDPIAEILIFSKTEDESKDFLDRMRGIYERLPAWMQASYFLIDQKKEWELPNESRAQALATTKGDSYAATLVIFDEADNTQNFGAMYGRTEPTVGDTGKIFVISTANKDKPNSLFKTMFLNAMEGYTDYIALFIAWFSHPDRNENWYEKTRLNYHRLYGSYDEFLGHYPETPQDALRARTLNKFFAPDWITRVWDNSEPIYHVGNELYPDPPSEIPNYAGLIIYEMPRVGAEYVIGTDTAEGTPTSDEAAIHVLEVPSLIEVAHFSGVLDATLTGYLSADLADLYNDALTLIERNNHGGTTIAAISNYAMINLGVGMDGKIGWNTNVASKPFMYNQAFDIFRYMHCVVRTQKTLLQLQNIERATLKAPTNMSDDCAVSYVLAIVCYVWSNQNSGWGGVFTPT